jgi:quinol monooxygenase YgiN
MKQLLISLLMVALMAAACTGRKAETAETSGTSGTELTEENNSFKMITARITIQHEFTADFIEAARSVIDSSNMEPGCISYHLYQDPYDQTRFVFVEEWADQDAIDHHFSMSYYIAFGPKVTAWQSEPVDLKIIDAVLTE